MLETTTFGVWCTCDVNAITPVSSPELNFEEVQRGPRRVTYLGSVSGIRRNAWIVGSVDAFCVFVCEIENGVYACFGGDNFNVVFIHENFFSTSPTFVRSAAASLFPICGESVASVR